MVLLALCAALACQRKDPPADTRDSAASSPPASSGRAGAPDPRELARLRTVFRAAAQAGLPRSVVCVEILESTDSGGILLAPRADVLDSLRTLVPEVIPADECRRRLYPSGDEPRPENGFYARAEPNRGLPISDDRESFAGRIAGDTTLLQLYCTIHREGEVWIAGDGCESDPLER